MLVLHYCVTRTKVCDSIVHILYESRVEAILFPLLLELLTRLNFHLLFEYFLSTFIIFGVSLMVIQFYFC